MTIERLIKTGIIIKIISLHYIIHNSQYCSKSLISTSTSKERLPMSLHFSVRIFQHFKIEFERFQTIITGVNQTAICARTTINAQDPGVQEHHALCLFLQTAGSFWLILYLIISAYKLNYRIKLAKIHKDFSGNLFCRKLFNQLYFDQLSRKLTFKIKKETFPK